MFKKTLLTMALISMSSAAIASGYQISEYSTTNLGRSFAGAGVVGDDFSAMGFNPAGMSFNKTNGIQAGAAGILLHSDYEDNRTGDKRSSKMGRVLPHFFGQYKATDNLTLGAAFYTPYGLITDYKNDFWGSNHGLFSGLKVMDLSAGFSYQVHPMVSVGAAINGQYIHARLTNTGMTQVQHPAAGAVSVPTVNDMEGDDTGVGYMLGLTFSPRKDIRLGASYRSKVSHELEGDLKVGTAFGGKEMDIHAKLTTPELVLLSAAYDVNDKLTLSATARWTKWQRFDKLDILSGNLPLSSTTENWKNTWFYSIGADYKVNDNWTVRFGGAYDETVINSPYDRTVRVPDGRRLFASIGLSYAVGNWQYDLAYTHVWMRSGDAKGGDKVAEATGNAPDIHYNNSGAYMGGFSIQYKF